MILVFIKYRHHFSSGEGRWEYMYLYIKKEAYKELKKIKGNLNKYLEYMGYDLESEYNYSEHYRGYESILLKKNSKECKDYVKEQIEKSKNIIKNHENLIIEFNKILGVKNA